MASLWISPVAVPEPVSPRPRPHPAPRHRPSGRAAPRARVAPVAPPVRWVYVRRRLVAVAVICALFLVGWQALAALGRSAVADAGTQWRAVPDVPVVVHHAAPGDTLWDLAVAYGPDADPRRSLDVLVLLNGGSELVVGQAVQVPASWLEPAP